MKPILSVLALVLLVPSALPAGAIVYSGQFDNRGSPLLLPKFDPTLGRLTGVQLGIEGTAGGLFLSSGGLVESGTFRVEIDAIFARLDDQATVDAPFTISDPWYEFTLSTPFSASTVAVDGLDRFTGIGGMDLDVFGYLSAVGLSPDGATCTLYHPSVAGVATLTYTYDAAPEPSSLLMGLLAIMVIWAMSGHVGRQFQSTPDGEAGRKSNGTQCPIWP